MKSVIIIYVIFAVIYFIVNCIYMVKAGNYLDNWWFYPVSTILAGVMSVVWPLCAVASIIAYTMKRRNQRIINGE